MRVIGDRFALIAEGRAVACHLWRHELLLQHKIDRADAIIAATSNRFEINDRGLDFFRAGKNTIETKLCRKEMAAASYLS